MIDQYGYLCPLPGLRDRGRRTTTNWFSGILIPALHCVIWPFHFIHLCKQTPNWIGRLEAFGQIDPALILIYVSSDLVVFMLMLRINAVSMYFAPISLHTLSFPLREDGE